MARASAGVTPVWARAAVKRNDGRTAIPPAKLLRVMPTIIDFLVLVRRHEPSDVRQTCDIVLWGKIRPRASLHPRPLAVMTLFRVCGSRPIGPRLLLALPPATTWHTEKRLQFQRSIHASPSGSAT